MTTPPEIPDTSLSPLARARRREARLRRLEDQLMDNSEDEVLWTRYLEVVNTLANLAGQAAPPMVTTQQLAESPRVLARDHPRACARVARSSCLVVTGGTQALLR